MGRNRLRYLEDVEKDIREMKVKRWRQKAVHRERWMLLMRKAKFLREP